MMAKNVFCYCSLLLILLSLIKFCSAINIQGLNDWHAKISDQNFSCPAPKESLSKMEKSQPLFKVVDCEEPSSLYKYDFKVRRLTRYNLKLSES